MQPLNTCLFWLLHMMKTCAPHFGPLETWRFVVGPTSLGWGSCRSGDLCFLERRAQRGVKRKRRRRTSEIDDLWPGDVLTCQREDEGSFYVETFVTLKQAWCWWCSVQSAGAMSSSTCSGGDTRAASPSASSSLCFISPTRWGRERRLSGLGSDEQITSKTVWHSSSTHTESVCLKLCAGVHGDQRWKILENYC